MAVSSFIPQIWEARLMAKFHERAIVDLITMAPTKVEGNKVIFNGVSDVAIKDYEGNVAFDDLTTSAIELNLDHKKYFAFKVDDVDAVQAAGELIDPHVAEAGYKLQEATDKYVLDAALAGGQAVAAKDGEKAYDVIVRCNTALNKKKVPKGERSIVINAEVLEELQLDERFTHHYQILENGVIEGADINGVKLIFSEELNAGAFAVVALHKSAIGYACQLKETEAMRLQDSFADGVRGLQLDGVKVLRADAIAKYVKA